MHKVFFYILILFFFYSRSQELKVYFKKTVVEYHKKDLIENVVVISNYSNEFKKVKIDILVPEEWKIIKNNKTYIIEPLDSLAIPIYVLPKGTFGSTTRLLIFCNITDEKGTIISTNFFTCIFKKSLKWSVLTPTNTIYLPLDTTQWPFEITVVNESNFSQDILLNINTNKKKVIIKDSLNSKIVKFPITFSLNESRDTTFYFTYNKLREPKNFRYIDEEEYRPFSYGEPRKDKVSIITQSPNPTEASKFRAGSSIEFISLSDRYIVNKFATTTIPLIVDINSFNLLGDQPMTNILLRGETFLKDSSFFVYTTQTTFFTNYFTWYPFKNIPFFIGYFHKKFSLQAGDISSGLYGSLFQHGKGLKSEYNFNPNHKIGLFYLGYPEVFKIMPQRYSYGLNHYIDTKKIKAHSAVGVIENQNDNSSIYTGNTHITFKFLKQHSFGISTGLSYKIQHNNNDVTIGFLSGFSYGGQIIPKIWRLNVNFRYNTSDFSEFKYERYNVNLNNNILIKKEWNLNIQNRYYRQESYSYLHYYEMLENLLTIQNYRKNFFVTPTFFYNIMDIGNLKYHSRGINLNTKYINLDNNIRTFYNVRAGFNMPTDTLRKNYFFIQNNCYLTYRVFTFNLSYTIGSPNLSLQHLRTIQYLTPQELRLSTRYQYQFRNPRFIYNQQLSYSYSNIINQVIFFMPEIVYYSYSGWRFKIFIEHTLSKQNKPWYLFNIYQTLNPELKEKKSKWVQNIFVGAGIRKEFGIPVPFVKQKNVNIKFYTFYDINGNNKKDPQESFIDNIVIRVNSWEVITNKLGIAEMENIPIGVYSIIVFPAINIEGWYPLIGDSINISHSQSVYIPFVRAIKVSGKVFLQRDPNSPTADFKLDISRIKITASNHKTYSTLTNRDGSFELYLPAGRYTISLDESIIGKRFQIVKNNYEIDVKEGFENTYITFFIVEKPRKIKVKKFDDKGNIIENNNE
ncbi:MAG: hypothetical protein N3A01_08685 [Bacteroidales bacterium]|nr:hypothetical protein [Bacteroidales bacterium]